MPAYLLARKSGAKEETENLSFPLPLTTPDKKFQNMMFVKMKRTLTLQMMSGSSIYCINC